MSRFANKLFIFLLTTFPALHAHDQLLLVVADDMNSSSAFLQRYERSGAAWKRRGDGVRVNLGRNGLGWGSGTLSLPHAASDPVKHEGDGRAPAGVFTLGPVFGYPAVLPTAMPYLQATADLICIDDSRSDAYNRIVPVRPPLAFGSFEWMHRKDGLYEMGVVVGHNRNAVPGRGSCIFLHIQRAPGAGTAGCTSMARSALSTLIRWLDPAKSPLLVQIPAKSLPDLRERFRGIGE